MPYRSTPAGHVAKSRHRAPRTSVLLLACASLVSVAACATATTAEYVEPSFEAGLLEDSEFRAFNHGDDIALLTAVQQGLWFMPVLRYQGLSGRPNIDCTIFDLDRDMFLADVEGHIAEQERDDWTIVFYNMEAKLPDDDYEDRDELEDMENDRVQFECQARDKDGMQLAISREMHLRIE